MLLVIPIARRDARLALELIQWVEDLGGLGQHHLLILHESLGEDARGMDVAVPKDAEITQVPDVSGWPAGPNSMFRSAASAAERIGMPWYFFEPDNTPTRSGWLDALESEYRLHGKPFMGHLQPRVYEQARTKERIVMGSYLLGTALYPPNLRDYTQAHLECVNAFDLAMDVPHLTHNTALIQNNWNTQDYRETDSAITCSAAPFRSGQAGDALAYPVNPRAAVVHGCKDGSLIHVLRARRNRALPMPETQVA